MVGRATANTALVAWTESSSSSSILGPVKATRVTTSGHVLSKDPTPFTLGTSAYASTLAGHTNPNTADQTNPRVVADGTLDSLSKSRFYVAFEDSRNVSSSGIDVYERWLNSDGTGAAATQPVITITGDQRRPQLAKRDTNAVELVMFNDLATTTFDYGAIQFNLASGLVGSPLFISDGHPIRETLPVVACATTTSCVVPYQWFNTADTTTEIDRVKARVVSYP